MGMYQVKGSIVDNRHTRFESRAFSMDNDQPVEAGGSDQGMTPVETLLGAIATCKLISASSLAGKSKIQWESFSLTISGQTGRIGTVEGTHVPSTALTEVHTRYEIKSAHSKEEIETFLHLVNHACTVANSLSPAIEHSQEIILL